MSDDAKIQEIALKRIRKYAVGGMLISCAVALWTMLTVGHAQTSAASTNYIKTPHLLFVTTPTNMVSISNAVKVASSLRIDMPSEDVFKHLRDHGMRQTNVYSLSVDRGRTSRCFYPLGDGGVFLTLEMACTERPKSGLFGWENPILKGANIMCGASTIISITLTNAP